MHIADHKTFFVKRHRIIRLLAMFTIVLVAIGIATFVLETPAKTYSFSGNLIVNSAFRNGLTGWSTSQQTHGYSLDSNTSIYSGCCSVMATETGNASIGLLYQDVTGVTHPGDSYRISGWIKTEDLVGQALIALDYASLNAKTLTPADGHVMTIGHADGTRAWTYFQSSVFTLPSRPADASALWFYLSNSVGSGTAWFDNSTLVATVPENCQSADSSNNFQESMPLAFGLATADLWNMMNATGYAEQCYGTTTGLSSSILLNRISLIQPFDFVVGYPEVAFGHNYMGQEFGLSDLASIKFPMQLQSLENSDMWTNMTYSISSSHPSQMDFAYDLWVKNSTQLGVPTSGDFEIMIDPVNTYLYTSIPEARMNNESIVMDGLKQSSSWSVYSFPYGGTNAKLTIFALNSPAQSFSGAISLKPQDFISFLRSSMGYNIPETYWLMGIELGSEFYPLPLSTQTTWSWSIARLSISTLSSDVVVIS